MAESAAHLQILTMRREKRAVALNSMLAAMLITGLKLVVGLATASLGILSEAAHSGLDLIAAAVTLFSVRITSTPTRPLTSPCFTTFFAGISSPPVKTTRLDLAIFRWQVQ